MNVHLYMSCYRVEALIASHLEPEEFGTYMAVGTQKLASGLVMFFEIDPGFRSDYFNLENLAARCVPHQDGAPKRSLYISIYRVLEHSGLDAVGALYLVTRDGRVLRVDPQERESYETTRRPHLYQELCPVTPLIASILAPVPFCKFITNPSSPIYVPRIFFADMRADRDEIGRLASYLPYSSPEHIEDCLRQLTESTGKKTKTVDRDHSGEFLYRTVGAGFFLGDQDRVKFYPFPSQEQLHGEYYSWWRSASMGL